MLTPKPGAADRSKMLQWIRRFAERVRSTSILLLVAGSLHAAVLPNPVGWWPGDGSPDNLVGTNSAVLKGGAGYTSAVFGQGFTFDGVSNVVSVPDDPSQHSSQITIACWVKFNELLTSGAATPGLQYLMFKRRPANNGFEGYTLVKDRLTGRDRFKMVVANGPGAANQVATAGLTIIETNRFYFVAGTADGTFARLYVNGILEGKLAAPFAINSGTKPLVFGSSEESYDGRFSGVLDEPQIFDRALNETEIGALFEQASAAPRLEISQANGERYVSWPALFASWSVESSADLRAWEPFSTPATRTGYTLSIKPPKNLPSLFLRLEQP